MLARTRIASSPSPCSSFVTCHLKFIIGLLFSPNSNAKADERELPVLVEDGRKEKCSLTASRVLLEGAKSNVEALHRNASARHQQGRRECFEFGDGATRRFGKRLIHPERAPAIRRPISGRGPVVALGRGRADRSVPQRGQRDPSGQTDGRTVPFH